jgi:hypothetical protein
MLANPADEGLFASLTAPDSAMRALEEFAIDTDTGKEGPINIGKLNRIRDLDAFRVIARHYRDAFERGNKVFPTLWATNERDARVHHKPPGGTWTGRRDQGSSGDLAAGMSVSQLNQNALDSGRFPQMKL